METIDIELYWSGGMYELMEAGLHDEDDYEAFEVRVKRALKQEFNAEINIEWMD